jgi:hypothetical protein
VCETTGDPGGERVSEDEAIDRLGRQRDRILVNVTPETHEQHLLVT